MVEKQLEAARRDDFEALLSGQNPQGLARMQRLATVVKLRESLPRPAPVPEPGPAVHKPSEKRVQTAASQASDRPYSTQSSIYSDMTAMSGSTVYLHDDKLVKKLPFVRHVPSCVPFSPPVLPPARMLSVAHNLSRSLSRTGDWRYSGDLQLPLHATLRAVRGGGVVGWWGGGVVGWWGGGVLCLLLGSFYLSGHAAAADSEYEEEVG